MVALLALPNNDSDTTCLSYQKGSKSLRCHITSPVDIRTQNLSPSLDPPTRQGGDRAGAHRTQL